MPIRFRCGHCNRLLGIATRKAGAETTCPHCGATITVPTPAEESGKTERLNLEDIDQLLDHATERVTEPATQVLEPPRTDAPAGSPKQKASKAPLPRSASKSPATKPEPEATPDEPPLFENDLELIFGPTALPLEDNKPKRSSASSKDALSLEDKPQGLVISPQKATLLMGGVVVLLALAFAAGYLVAR